MVVRPTWVDAGEHFAIRFRSDSEPDDDAAAQLSTNNASLNNKYPKRSSCLRSSLEFQKLAPAGTTYKVSAEEETWNVKGMLLLF